MVVYFLPLKESWSKDESLTETEITPAKKRGVKRPEKPLARGLMLLGEGEAIRRREQD